MWNVACSFEEPFNHIFLFQKGSTVQDAFMYNVLNVSSPFFVNQIPHTHNTHMLPTKNTNKQKKPNHNNNIDDRKMK